MNALHLRLSRIERIYRRFVLTSKWSLFRIGFVLMLVLFLVGIVAAARGSTFPWHKVFIGAFVITSIAAGGSWLIAGLCAFARRDWVTGIAMTTLVGAVVHFAALAVLAAFAS